jgi:hypothetical protein
MPDRIACKFCAKVGFVRRERVIKGRRSIESFYCGACNRAWKVADDAADDVEGRSLDQTPRRS